MGIVLAHIEPIEERYTKQWLDSIKPHCKAVIGSEELQVINDGQFLDVKGTNKFKLEQGIGIINAIEQGVLTDDDTLFFLDLWNPVVCNINYIKYCMEYKFKIAGMLHAGTWDSHDFLSKQGLGHWCRGLEQSMIESANKIIVATDFHKNMIEDYFRKAYPTMVVEKFPVFTPDIKSKKENIVVFPHRLADEKQPFLFDKLKQSYYNKYGNWNDDIKWIKTKDVWTNKNEYYKLLARSKVAVSFALQETFGIAMLESLNLGCIPLAPNRLSYKETLPEYLYEDMDDLVEKIHDALNKYERPQPYGVKDFTNIIKHLK